MINKNNKAYTLVEIMIVVAIVGIITAIAAPNYLKTSNVSSINVCINNLKQIDSAIDQWAFDNNIDPGTVPTVEQEIQIYSYIDGADPKCPSDGEYIINAVGSNPQVRCSKEDVGHKLPE